MRPARGARPEALAMHSFSYQRAQTVDQALAAIGPDAKFLAVYDDDHRVEELSLELMAASYDLPNLDCIRS